VVATSKALGDFVKWTSTTCMGILASTLPPSFLKDYDLVIPHVDDPLVPSMHHVDPLLVNVSTLALSHFPSLPLKLSENIDPMGYPISPERNQVPS
jgi:hypothetical protein